MDSLAIENLVAKAASARKHCYAPYSKFLVGAAILLEDGQIITGVNIENASYPVSLCAERSAMATAISQGLGNEIEALAIINSSPILISPCGMCRQFLSEFLSASTPIILANDQGLRDLTDMAELLPKAFVKDSLGIK